MSKVKFKRKNTEEIKNLGVEDGSLIFNYEDGTTYMDYEDRRIKMCGGDEITELLAVTDTAPTEFNSGDKYYNTTDKCIYTATDDTNWGTTGEDPATNKLYVDLSESKLYYYDGIDFKSYGGGVGGGGETLPVGTILPYTGGTLPSGYMLCDGSAISRKTYSKLFEIIGTSYGAGDGTTTFNLPNLKGRVPVGQDDTDTDFDTLGKTGGEKEHTLTPSEIPNHTHVIYSAGNTSYGAGCVTSMGNRSGSNPNTNTIAESNCKDQPHNNLQPYQVVRYIIKVSQTTPIQSQVVGGYSTSTEDSYCCNYVNNAIKEVYSTEEVKTNKIWIDGKPVYRKCYSGSCSDLTNILDNTYKNGDIVFTNCGGSISQTNGTRRMNVGGYINSNWNSGLYLAEQGIILYVSSELTQGNFELFVEYTKTTDSGTSSQ